MAAASAACVDQKRYSSINTIRRARSRVWGACEEINTEGRRDGERGRGRERKREGGGAGNRKTRDTALSCNFRSSAGTSHAADSSSRSAVQKRKVERDRDRERKKGGGAGNTKRECYRCPPAIFNFFRGLRQTAAVAAATS